MPEDPTGAAPPPAGLKDALGLLDAIAGWPENDWQGLKYHAMAIAGRLRAGPAVPPADVVAMREVVDKDIEAWACVNMLPPAAPPAEGPSRLEQSLAESKRKLAVMEAATKLPHGPERDAAIEAATDAMTADAPLLGDEAAPLADFQLTPPEKAPPPSGALCTECSHVFTAEDLARESGGWGHPCRAATRGRITHCESYREPILVDPAAPPAEGRHEDFAWAVERVTRMAGCYQLNAEKFGPKLLKGHGYPDEVMRDAQDYRALSIVLQAAQGQPPAAEGEALRSDEGNQGRAWPDAVSDGLTLPCADCGQVPRFDFQVEDEFWRRHVPGDARLGVVCLPCLDRRCGGVGLDEALLEVQWTGTGHTVVLRPSLRHRYALRATQGESVPSPQPCKRCNGAGVDTYVDPEAANGFTERPCPACSSRESQPVPSPKARRHAELPDAVSVKMLQNENAVLTRRLEACAPYLKDGETPAQCIERNRGDIHTLMELLATEKRKVEALEAERDLLRGDLDAALWPRQRAAQGEPAPAPQGDTKETA